MRKSSYHHSFQARLLTCRVRSKTKLQATLSHPLCSPLTICKSFPEHPSCVPPPTAQSLQPSLSQLFIMQMTWPMSFAHPFIFLPRSLCMLWFGIFRTWPQSLFRGSGVAVTPKLRLLNHYSWANRGCEVEEPEELRWRPEVTVRRRQTRTHNSQPPTVHWHEEKTQNIGCRAPQTSMDKTHNHLIEWQNQQS